MPIDIEEFENGDSDILRGSNTQHEDELIDFLSYDSSLAYTIREIQESTSLSILEIAARLGHLHEKGVVRNNGSYWAIAEDFTRNEQ